MKNIKKSQKAAKILAVLFFGCTGFTHAQISLDQMRDESSIALLSLTDALESAKTEDNAPMPVATNLEDAAGSIEDTRLPLDSVEGEYWRELREHLYDPIVVKFRPDFPGWPLNETGKGFVLEKNGQYYIYSHIEGVSVDSYSLVLYKTDCNFSSAPCTSMNAVAFDCNHVYGSMIDAYRRNGEKWHRININDPEVRKLFIEVRKVFLDYQTSIPAPQSRLAKVEKVDGGLQVNFLATGYRLTEQSGDVILTAPDGSIVSRAELSLSYDKRTKKLEVVGSGSAGIRGVFIEEINLDTGDIFLRVSEMSGISHGAPEFDTERWYIKKGKLVSGKGTYDDDRKIKFSNGSLTFFVGPKQIGF